MPDRFYLDANATTPLRSEVLARMTPYLTEFQGNPSSVHSYGRAARAAVDTARDELASVIGSRSKEIIFTSGGTESNNLALVGVSKAHASRGRHLITCATEHHSVLHPLESLRHVGFETTVLPVDAKGRLDPALLEKALRSDTILVSIMSANNETGTCHDIPVLSRICRAKKVLFHCDAIQSLGKEKVHVEDWGVDLLSLAAHKFYGPKGVGALYLRSGTRMEPLQRGGFHENERRAGTENVAGIVGMSAAARLAMDEAAKEGERLFHLVERLWEQLNDRIQGIHRNGDPEHRIGNTLNVSFDGCKGQELLVALDLEGIAVSSGSACMVGSIQPSHVLQAMGVSDAVIRATVRFSLSQSVIEPDIPEIVSRVEKVVTRLRTL